MNAEIEEEKEEYTKEKKNYKSKKPAKSISLLDDDIGSLGSQSLLSQSDNLSSNYDKSRNKVSAQYYSPVDGSKVYRRSQRE